MAEVDDRGWDKLLAFMVSGEPGSFVLWALVVWGVVATLRRARGSPDAGYSGGDGDGDGGGGD